MSIQNIQVGDVVPIELQLADGSPVQYPRALVYDEGSTPLTTIDLAHDNQGNYSGNSYNMPDTGFVKVVYIVYSDSGHTTLNEDYERDIEVFYRILPDEFKATGFGLAGEYDARMTTLQADLDNPDQYKATGFAVPGEYTDILNRLLGLDQENQFIDTCVYAASKLTSARLRIYSDAVSVGTDLNVVATYTITTTYNVDDDMESYKMVLNP